jgi:AcrR family transcriptional regulator
MIGKLSARASMLVGGLVVADGESTHARADARRNREHILQVAHDALTESGATSLNEIAKRAGVGAGTLYRHFPNREALILAVYQRDVEVVLNLVDDLLAGHAPLDAFRLWFSTLADYGRAKQGLGEALHNAPLQNACHDTYTPLINAVARLIDACIAESSLRPDLDPEEVLLLMGFLWRVPDGPEGKEKARRIMDLAIEALKPTGG